jgi:hypothetical protein
LSPESWQKADVIPESKKTGIQNQENYRGIELLNTGHKIHANITENKLTKYYYTEPQILQNITQIRLEKVKMDSTKNDEVMDILP